MADTITVTRDKAGVEDIYFGTGSFDRLASDGVTVLTIQQVNASHVPVKDARDLFASSYLEGVLEELYDLFTEAHIQSWYYIDENGTVLHGMGDVINRPEDIEANKSWYKRDDTGTVIHGMGDVIDL